MNSLKILLLNVIALAVCTSGFMQSANSPGRASGAVASGSSGSGGGGIVSDTGNGCGFSYNSVPTLSCDIKNVTAGETIVVNFTAYSNNFSGLTDSNTGTVAILPGYPVAFSGGGYDYMFVIMNAGAGTHTITASADGNFTYPTIIADVVSGASASAPIDTWNNFMSTSPAGNNVTFACGDISTTQPNELLISFVNLVGPSPSLTAGTSPQQMTISQEPVPNAGSEYGTAANPGTNHVEWGLPTGGNPFVCDTVTVH
jgi:hypothetical protein